MMASHSALRSSALMPLAASGRLSRSRAMPSAMSSRTEPLSIMGFPPSVSSFDAFSSREPESTSLENALDEERERKQRFLVVDQDHLLVRHFQLAIGTPQPVFVAGGPDGIVAQAGFEHHAVAGDRDIAAGLLVQQLDIGDEPPQPRLRRLCVTLASQQLLDAKRDARTVVVNDRHFLFGI